MRTSLGFLVCLVCFVCLFVILHSFHPYLIKPKKNFYLPLMESIERNQVSFHINNFLFILTFHWFNLNLVKIRNYNNKSNHHRKVWKQPVLVGQLVGWKCACSEATQDAVDIHHLGRAESVAQR